MKHTLDYIKSNPSDFKVCSECLCLNWYENEVCNSCGGKIFENNDEKIIGWVDEEIRYLKDELGYNDDFIANKEYDF